MENLPPINTTWQRTLLIDYVKTAKSANLSDVFHIFSLKSKKCKNLSSGKAEKLTISADFYRGVKW